MQQFFRLKCKEPKQLSAGVPCKDATPRTIRSGQHGPHIRTLTDLLLHQLVRRTDRYQLDESDISLISTASALHDIGKIMIPDGILNKPGRLTEEEYAVIKTHTTEGAKILKDLSSSIGGADEPLLQVAHAICRWPTPSAGGTMSGGTAAATLTNSAGTRSPLRRRRWRWPMCMTH